MTQVTPVPALSLDALAARVRLLERRLRQLRRKSAKHFEEIASALEIRPKKTKEPTP